MPRASRQLGLGRRLLVRGLGRAGIAALVAIALGTAVGLHWPRKDKGLSEERWTQVKLDARDRADVLVLGDSRAGSGLLPEVLAPHFPGKAVFNWSFSNNGYTKAYLDDVEQVLRKGEGRVIIASISPYAFTPKHQVGGYLGARKPWFTEVKLRHAWQLLDFVRPIPKWEFLDVLRGRTERGWHHVYRDDGSFDGWMVPARPDFAPVRARHEYINQRVSPAIVDGFFEHVAAWRRQGIAVFVVRPPASVEMEALETESQFDQAAFIARLEALGGRWIEIPRGAQWESYDGSHIPPHKARELSELVGRAAQAMLRGEAPPALPGTVDAGARTATTASTSTTATSTLTP